MASQNVEKYTMNALSLELKVPYGTMYNAVRRAGILDSLECEKGTYLIPPRKMRQLRRAANVAKLYRLGFDKALQIVDDGFVPPADKVGIREGVA